MMVFACAISLAGGFLTAASAQEAKDGELMQVEAQYVCMINNMYFNKKAQIPVDVEGVTYYGCCEMCKEKLKNDKESRWATDPVSRKKVDKAKAVIGATSDGSVHYFESAANLKKFKAEK